MMLQSMRVLAEGIGHALVSRMHDLSVAALAAAVIVLGAVMLLELRALAQLRTSLDRNLARVFEQLDLLRFDQAQLREPPEVSSVSGRDSLQAATGERRGPIRDAVAVDLRARMHAAPFGEGRREREESVAIGRTGSSGGLDASGIALTREAQGALGAGEARLMASLAEARSRRAARGQ